jgi:hypothetical protein
MIILPVINGVAQGVVPGNAIRTELAIDGLRVYLPGDNVPVIVTAPDADEPLRQQFEAEQQSKLAADFAAFKARAGLPSYKAAAVKIAAEKLGALDAIEAAAAQTKELLIWWQETDAISQGDAQWVDIAAAVAWPKDVTAGAVFDLAAQV